MSSLLDRDPFESYLRSLEAKLPRLEPSIRALRERDADGLYASAVAGTVLEPVIDRAIEEGWSLELAEERVWEAIAEVYAELRECTPSSYHFVLDAFEALMDLENLARVFSGARVPEELLPLGPLRKCLASEGSSVEKCLSESALTKFVDVETLSRALASLDDFLYTYVLARLSIAREIARRFEGLGLDLPIVESARNILASEVAFLNAFCSLTPCPEPIHRGVRDALGIDASRASDLVRSRAGEEVLEAIERGREARDTTEVLEAVATNIVKPMLSVGEGVELLLSILILAYLGPRLSLAAYALKRGVIRV